MAVTDPHRVASERARALFPELAISIMASPSRCSYRADMKLKGTIRRSDLEGGHWVLQTETGDQYQLVGTVA